MDRIGQTRSESLDHCICFPSFHARPARVVINSLFVASECPPMTGLLAAVAVGIERHAHAVKECEL